jgi:ribosomal protein S18 acetylase RimI-like enzyme
MLSYVDSIDGITPRMLHGFFSGWKRPLSPETHLTILRNSEHIVLVVDHETGQVVGFVTAISDGVQSAFIPLLEVLPSYRGKGIGTELMSRILKKLGRIPAIDLTSDPALQGF